MRRCASETNRGDDAATGACDLFIGGALQAHLEFFGAIAGVDEMGVAVDEAGGDPAAFAVGDFCVAGGGHVGFGACVQDAFAADEHCALFHDAEAGACRRERCETRVAPEAGGGRRSVMVWLMYRHIVMGCNRGCGGPQSPGG